MWTAPELSRQMNGRIDTVLVPAGTGGTLGGVGLYFRLASPQTRVVAVDVHGSVIFGGPPGQRRLVGIGSARPSSFITPDPYDEHILVGDQEAFDYCRALRAETGVSLGGSAGAVLAACVRYLRGDPSAQRVVCVCPDGGASYESTLYIDAWLVEHGYDTAAARPRRVLALRRAGRARLERARRGPVRGRAGVTGPPPAAKVAALPLRSRDAGRA